MQRLEVLYFQPLHDFSMTLSFIEVSYYLVLLVYLIFIILFSFRWLWLTSKLTSCSYCEVYITNELWGKETYHSFLQIYTVFMKKGMKEILLSMLLLWIVNCFYTTLDFWNLIPMLSSNDIINIINWNGF